MIMGYNYSPHSTDEKARQFFSKRGKHLAVTIVIIFLIAVFYATGIAMTSYATYSRNAEQLLNETKANLVILQAEKDVCLASLNYTDNDLKVCQGVLSSKATLLNTCDTEKTSLNNSLTNTVSSLNACKTEKDSAIQTSRQLVRNSVKAICCSYGDVQVGFVRNWDIFNDSITCTGIYTVNCGTGQTNY